MLTDKERIKVEEFREALIEFFEKQPDWFWTVVWSGGSGPSATAFQGQVKDTCKHRVLSVIRFLKAEIGR